MSVRIQLRVGRDVVGEACISNLSGDVPVADYAVEAVVDGVQVEATLRGVDRSQGVWRLVERTAALLAKSEEAHG